MTSPAHKVRTVRRAQAGDPRAVRHLLRALEAFLRGSQEIPDCYALFLADGLERLRSDSKAWGIGHRLEDAETEFRSRDRSKDTPLDRIFGTGARLPEERLNKIGHAFGQAFYLTRRLPRPSQALASKPALPNGLIVSGSTGRAVRISKYVVVAADKTVIAAKRGDPKAFRCLLQAVEASLREGNEIPAFIASFFAECLEALLADSEAWKRIGRSQARNGRASRTSTNDVRVLGRAFCRSFCLSKPQGRLKTGEVPKRLAAYPSAVYNGERLVQHGVSRRVAIRLVVRAHPSYSKRTVDEWLRFMKIGLPRPGTGAGGNLIENRLRIAAVVVCETACGRSLEAAYLEAARCLAGKLFPCQDSRLKKWAARVLQELERGGRRPSKHVKLAQRIQAAVQRRRRLPSIPKELIEEVVPQICAEKGSTFLPEDAVVSLIPAVRKAYAFMLDLGSQWPRWTRIRAFLEKRYSPLRLAS